MDEVLVVDASAIVLLAASTWRSADALAARLASSVIHAPHLLPVEVDSAVRGLLLGGHLTEAEASAARAVAHALPVDLWPLSAVADRVWELRANLKTYDAAYVALAERLDATLVTADKKLARVGGVRCAVELFG